MEMEGVTMVYNLRCDTVALYNSIVCKLSTVEHSLSSGLRVL